MARVSLEFAGDSRDAVGASERLQRSLRQVEREADQVSRQSSGHLRGLERTATSVGTSIERNLLGATRRAAIGIGVALGAAGGYVGVLGLNFYRTQQSAQIAFTTILKDGGRARKLLGELAKFAADTPFEFPDLLRTSQRLLNAGLAAKQIIPVGLPRRCVL